MKIHEFRCCQAQQGQSSESSGLVKGLAQSQYYCGDKNSWQRSHFGQYFWGKVHSFVKRGTFSPTCRVSLQTLLPNIRRRATAAHWCSSYHSARMKVQGDRHSAVSFMSLVAGSRIFGHLKVEYHCIGVVSTEDEKITREVLTR